MPRRLPDTVKKFRLLLEIIRRRLPINVKNLEIVHDNSNNIYYKYKTEKIRDDSLHMIGEVRYRYQWGDEFAARIAAVLGIAANPKEFLTPVFNTDNNTFKGLRLDLANYNLTNSDFEALFTAIAANDNFASMIIELILDGNIVTKLIFPENLTKLEFLSMNYMTDLSERDLKKMLAPNLKYFPSLKIISILHTLFISWPNFKETALQHIFVALGLQEGPPELPESLLGYHVHNSIAVNTKKLDVVFADISSKKLPNLRGLFFTGDNDLINLRAAQDATTLTLAYKICLSRIRRENFAIRYQFESDFLGGNSVDHDLYTPEQELVDMNLSHQILEQHFSAIAQEPYDIIYFLKVYFSLVRLKFPDDTSKDILKYLLPASKIPYIEKNANTLQNMFADTEDQGSKDTLDYYIKNVFPSNIERDTMLDPHRVLIGLINKWNQKVSQNAENESSRNSDKSKARLKLG